MIDVVVSVITHIEKWPHSPLIGEGTERKDEIICFVAHRKSFHLVALFSGLLFLRKSLMYLLWSQTPYVAEAAIDALVPPKG